MPVGNWKTRKPKNITIVEAGVDAFCISPSPPLPLPPSPPPPPLPSLRQARTSGVLQRYSLPRLALESRHKAECRPHRITLNSTSSKVAIIDTAGVLSLYDLVCAAPASYKNSNQILDFFVPKYAIHIHKRPGTSNAGRVSERFD